MGSMAEVLLERPPETEIYGRSLSSVYRLGAFMVNASLYESIRSPEADQARVEFYTSVEEGFGTDMELGGGLEVRDFDTRPVITGRVMAKDLKTAISGLTGAGLACAEITAENDWRFKPQLIRSKWDHSNALLVDAMARGETDYNTIIVASPFPEEAAAQSGDDYWRNIGYVPHLRRGFVQMYHASQGEVVSGSLSFDGSDKQKLRRIFSQHGQEIPEDETTDNWLKYAITGTLSEDQARELAAMIADQADGKRQKKTTNTVDVTREHRRIMDQVFDESYVHISESLFRGYQTEGAAGLVHQLADKAHHFNDRYTKALYKMRANTHEFTDDDSIVLHELLVYSTIEMMRALHLGEVTLHNNRVDRGYDAGSSHAYVEYIDSVAFQNMLSSFGAAGARHGRTYSACGLAISAGGDKGEYNELDALRDPQAAFGGADREESNGLQDDRYGSRTFKCPKKGCLNIRPRNTLIPKCQMCGADVTC